MRKERRRGLSLLLVLVMLLGLLPGTAWGAEPEGQAITVRMTVYDQGVPAQDKEGTPMLLREIRVTDRDRDGYYSLDEALTAAHADYAPNGASDYAAGQSDWGYSVTRLWGKKDGVGGFYRNDQLTAAVNEEMLEQGDRVTGFTYKDLTNWSDRYSYFTQDALTVQAGTEFALTLKCVQYNESWELENVAVSGAPIGVFDANGSYLDEDALSGNFLGEHLFGDYYASISTGLSGETVFSIREPGTYIVTAQHDSSGYATYDGENNAVPNYLVPPLCTVTVLSEEDFAVYEKTQKYLDQAADLLTWDTVLGEKNEYSYSVTVSLTLPGQLAVEGKTVDVSWSCDDTTGAVSVSQYDGAWSAYVVRPAAQDVSCTLTAALSCDGASVTKEFPITVKAEGVSEDKESVVTYGDLLTTIAAGYTASADPWVVLEMAAYNGSSVKAESGYAAQSAAAAVLADAAIGQAADVSPLSGVDVSGAYAIYSVPYLSLAYQAAGQEGTDAHSPEALKKVMTDYLNALGESSDVEAVTPALAALAPYYSTDDAVKSAVDKGVAWLSQHQNSDGTFSSYGTSNANTTALAVVALAALGIDAHTDSRFIKNNKSAVEGLFSFALADHSGFGYKGNVTRNDLATEQGFRALVAYARMKANDKAYNIYLEAKDSADTVPAPNITATVKPDGGGSGSGGSSRVEVTVSVMVPPEGGADGQYTYTHDSASYTNLLGSSRRVTVTSGTTALAVLERVLGSADISYEASGGYVTEIGGLAEGDHGNSSGWQYLVDGEAPMESASTYAFEDDAKMVWYYTDDYTREESGEQWSGGGQAGEAAGVEKLPDGSYAVTLPKGSAGPVLVTIPEVSQGDLLVIVHADGAQEAVKKSVVQDGTAYLMLDENATVKVVDYVSDFNDVKEDAWYADAVDFTAGRGLFSGVGGGSFAPDETLNRGMVVTVLYALEDAGAQKTAGLFDDVAEDAWYAQGTAWAVEAGIVSGYGDGQFGPNDAITREQLALMLYRYAQSMKLSTGAGASLTFFGDEAQISAWAREAMSWAVGAGVLSGTPEGSLNPAGTATRAEAAVMVNQFVAWMLKG